jgi:hypothetical protein
MQLELLNDQGQSTAKVDAPDTVFARDYNEALVHQVVVAYQANARQGTRAQKNRETVKHSTKKPWRQKGTGRARAGMTSSPIWRGGGRTFPNSPDENFSHKVNKKMYRAGMASILSQTDVDINPGASECVPLLAGISRLTLNGTSVNRANLKLAKASGIAVLEKTSDGFQFRSGVTTLLTSGLTEITRRRSTDFLQISAGRRLRAWVKAKNTVLNRGTMLGELTAFSDELRDAGRIVEELLDADHHGALGVGHRHRVAVEVDDQALGGA